MIQHISDILQKQQKFPLSIPRRWWGPVWRGLTVEPTAKHYQAMGKAVWLFIYLIVHANRKTGITFRRLSMIAEEMGLPLRTIQFWLAKLRKAGYVTTTRNGRAITVAILKWKPLGQPPTKRQ